jgi:hypothetical protein
MYIHYVQDLFLNNCVRLRDYSPENTICAVTAVETSQRVTIFYSPAKLHRSSPLNKGDVVYSLFIGAEVRVLGY